MPRPVIHVENVSKQYRLGAVGTGSLKHDLNRAWHQLRGRPDPYLKVTATNDRTLKRRNTGPSVPADSADYVWALKDINFEVQQGEVLGIIGRNGAGKSTLLKLLSRVTAPTAGGLKVKGRIASLLEVGTGFHLELTGRENIYLNGAIMGMTRAEVTRKFDQIVDFSGCERYIDTPVKRYSSGMTVRLGFAVAAHLDPEILIVDEVLAVGDTEFQNKCLGKMSDVAHGGRTVIFVSHSMEHIGTLTEKCIYLTNGEIAGHGRSKEIVGQYLRDSTKSSGDAAHNIDLYRRESDGDSPVRITAVSVGNLDNANANPGSVHFAEPFTFHVHLTVFRKIQGAHLCIVLKTEQGLRAAILYSRDQGTVLNLEPGDYEIRVKVGNVPLAPGRYIADIGVGQSIQVCDFDCIVDYPILNILNEGRITHWPERPWGVIHPTSVTWNVTRPGQPNASISV